MVQASNIIDKLSDAEVQRIRKAWSADTTAYEGWSTELRRLDSAL